MKNILFLYILIPGIILAQFNQNDVVKYDSTINVNSNYFSKIGIISAATGVLLFIDEEVRDRMKIEDYHKNNMLDEIGHNYGDVYYSFYFAGTMYLTQFVMEDKSIARTGKTLFEALAVGSLASISLKFIFGRNRPYTENGNTKFDWFEVENRKNSLPSGHVITAFTTSTVLSRSIDDPYASVILYSLAGLTVYQRISSDNHWLSDTFLGASIGILVGNYFADLAEKENSNYLIIPFYSTSNTGISISYQF